MAPLLGDPAVLHDDDAIEVGAIGVPRVAQPEEVLVPSGRGVGKGANDCAPLQPINESPQQRRGDRHPAYATTRGAKSWPNVAPARIPAASVSTAANTSGAPTDRVSMPKVVASHDATRKRRRRAT